MPFAVSSSSSANRDSSIVAKLKHDLPCIRLLSSGDIDAFSSADA
jgi:hypothetical protein